MEKILEEKNKTILLPDGRVLGYAQSGDLEGKVLILFHGLSSSRLEVCPVHEEALKQGIRVIGVDRPGMGLSTFHKDRQIFDFVDDIVFLTVTLKIEKFSVMGISAGAAYALACVHKISDRILSCGIVSGIAPVYEFDMEGMSKQSRAFIMVAQVFPWLVESIFWLTQGRFSQNKKDEDVMLKNIMFTLDKVDKKLIKESTIRQYLVETFRESYKQGSEGIAHDGILAFAKPWGFKLEEIDFSPIYLWHGDKDCGIPVSMAKKMSKEIHGSKMKIYPNEGHLSLIFNKMDEIIHDIMA